MNQFEFQFRDKISGRSQQNIVYNNDNIQFFIITETVDDIDLDVQEINIGKLKKIQLIIYETNLGLI